MSQPEEHIKPGEENKICRLEKAIYGSKEAARVWNIKIGYPLKCFLQSTADPCHCKCLKEKILYK